MQEEDLQYYLLKITSSVLKSLRECTDSVQAKRPDPRHKTTEAIALSACQCVLRSEP